MTQHHIRRGAIASVTAISMLAGLTAIPSYANDFDIKTISQVKDISFGDKVGRFTTPTQLNIKYMPDARDRIPENLELFSLINGREYLEGALHISNPDRYDESQIYKGNFSGCEPIEVGNEKEEYSVVPRDTVEGQIRDGHRHIKLFNDPYGFVQNKPNDKVNYAITTPVVLNGPGVCYPSVFAQTHTAPISGYANFDYYTPWVANDDTDQAGITGNGANTVPYFTYYSEADKSNSADYIKAFDNGTPNNILDDVVVTHSALRGISGHRTSQFDVAVGPEYVPSPQGDYLEFAFVTRHLSDPSRPGAGRNRDNLQEVEGYSGKAVIPVIILPKKQEFSLSYNDRVVQAGETLIIEPTVISAPPAQTTFTFKNNVDSWITIDEATGTVTVNPPRDIVSVTKDLMVVVTTATGDEKEVPLKLQVFGKAIVPPVTSTTSTPTLSPAPSALPTPSSGTAIPPIPSSTTTPTVEPSPSTSTTPSATPTATAAPSSTTTPTATPAPSATATSSASPAPTTSATSSVTPTAEPTPTNSKEPVPESPKKGSSDNNGEGKCTAHPHIIMPALVTILLGLAAALPFVHIPRDERLEKNNPLVRDVRNFLRANRGGLAVLTAVSGLISLLFTPATCDGPTLADRMSS
ncbi:Rib/alpha-like domain-containing protein [Corynebacterium sp. ES2715-CONJ3]|uniref:Rib/alpha-like domain-containing protein n=1 Tax=Corynebacterium sp. ES2715-CONJ3 TaxID=2974028 RepID=UPI002169ABC1|nr:Rib/alpha-like domain-containing protein [Corynebacterium sp. ES2715-CONJ3]MCS4491367.1 hypothetical protein [Corynebacterium sp. ES2715-CONJ3]